MSLPSPFEEDECPVISTRRATFKMSSPSFDSLDEVHEVHWDQTGVVEPSELYEPMSLCLVSRVPLFDVLQVRARPSSFPFPLSLSQKFNPPSPTAINKTQI